MSTPWVSGLGRAVAVPEAAGVSPAYPRGAETRRRTATRIRIGVGGRTQRGTERMRAGTVWTAAPRHRFSGRIQRGRGAESPPSRKIRAASARNELLLPPVAHGIRGRDAGEGRGPQGNIVM